MGKVNQKKEKRERNEAQAKKFKRRAPVHVKKTKEASNYCRTKGHARSCEFNTCPSWNP